MAFGAPSPSAMTGVDNALYSVLSLKSEALYSPTLNQPLYFQQTTTSMLCSTISLALIGSLLCLLLFSWVRTRRSSIYASRQFFVREEHRADPLPLGFFSWIGGVLFLESKLKRELEMKNDEALRKYEAATASASISHSNSDGELVSNLQSLSSTRQTIHHDTVSGFEGRIDSTGHLGDINDTQNKVNSNSFEQSEDTKTGKMYPQNIDKSTASLTCTPGYSNNQGRSQDSQPSDDMSKPVRDILISKVGLDHYLLIRFLRMLSSLSVISAVLAIAVLVPVYNVGQSGEDVDTIGTNSRTHRVEALHIGNATNNERLFATVVVTAVVSVLITLWTWTELMVFLKLRKDFLFRSSSRYSSKVVLLQHIPKDLQSVLALKQALSTAPGGGVEHVYLVRDVSTLEKAVKRRQVVLDILEGVESRYMAAIARASALVSVTSLSMRSRSRLGKGLDRLKACFGHGGVDTVLAGNQSEGDYVGPLKMYQLDGVPKISLTDLSTPGVSSSCTLSGIKADSGVGTQARHHSNLEGSSSSMLTTLRWFQKPKRPTHYNGIPFLSKRQDSIRYYRGELCRLNKVISQEYEEQALAMAADQEYQGPGQRQAGVLAQETGKNSAVLQSDTNSDSTSSKATEKGGIDLITSKSNGVKVLSSAFVLMRTRAGAKAVASGTIASDKIPSSARSIGIPPQDIEWRALGQLESRWSSFFSRVMIPVVGILLLVVCGLVVFAISSMSVHNGWERASVDYAKNPTAPSVYLRQGIAAPIFLTMLTIAVSWILNELSKRCGRVSKIQTELLIQRSFFFILGVSVGLVHPITSLSLSWQESITRNTNPGSLKEFLVHAIPSYSSFAFSYILMSGLALPLYQLMQLPRLWATLPSITLWSALELLSWRKFTHTQDNSTKGPPSQSDSIPSSTTSGGSTADKSNSTAPSSSMDSRFEANFIPTPTLTPRQAFQLRQPPFFSLQNVYPHLILMFALSIALLPLAPVLFLLWLVVLVGLSLCYRYLIFQVVTTKSQSGGLHYLQALKLILFPTLACPPLLLAVYLGVRQAWVQSGFAIIITAAMLISRVVIGVQFKKREEMMLREVEEYHIRLKGPPQDSDQDFDLNTAFNTQDQSIHEAQDSAQTLCTAASSSQSPTLRLAQSNHTGHSVAFSDAAKNSHVKEGDELTETSPDDVDTHNTPYRRRVVKKTQRPTTIIGQVRSSIFGGISSSGLRPKSVSVFDIDRYEKEMLGLGYEQNNHRLYREDLDELQGHDIFRSEGARQENEVEGSGHGSYGNGHEFPISFDSVLPDTFDLNGGYATRRATAVNRCTLTRTQLEEEQREAKYREIVKALRRASSVATGKYPNQTLSGVNNLDMTANPSQDRQRRVYITNDAKNQFSSRDTGRESSVAGFVPRHPEPCATSQATKAQFRKSLPALLNPRPLSYNTNPYLFHQPSITEILSNASSTSSNGSNSGFPSLPMLLIHRELAVAAKEKNRIQNLYYNPVLREAKTRAIVWLPSQTERSFWGILGNDGMEHCKYHAELRQKQAAAPSATATTESAEDLSSFGLSTSTLAPTEQAHSNGLASYHRSKHQCTCRLYQQVTQAVADAVALADQEIRDLRIVGLTVWLDSRHVIWGQVNEEDGRLGDRVMISTAPHQLVSESTVKSKIQKQVGDGLLSWLELEDGEDGEIHNDHLRQIGQGAPGIIGGSVGLIMKRPIGNYGKLVGDGEEDDIPREC